MEEEKSLNTTKKENNSILHMLCILSSWKGVLFDSFSLNLKCSTSVISVFCVVLDVCVSSAGVVRVCRVSYNHGPKFMWRWVGKDAVRRHLSIASIQTELYEIVWILV